MDTCEKTKPRVTKQNIKAGLISLGLKKGDSIGVHRSLSSFGYVEGGADAVIDALLETVGHQGNVVMSTHSANLSEGIDRPVRRVFGERSRSFLR